MKHYLFIWLLPPTESLKQFFNSNCSKTLADTFQVFNMLTELEMKTLDGVYSLCCKSFTFPFTWENGKMSVKSIQHSFWNSLVQLLVLSTSILKVTQLFAPVGDNKYDINGLILHGILSICSGAAVIYEFNILLHGAELVQLINELLNVNSIWGNQNIQNFTFLWLCMSHAWVMHESWSNSV